MTLTPPSRTSPLWLIVLLPLTAFILFTFTHLFAWLMHRPYSPHRIYLVCAVIVAGANTLYGLVETMLCLVRHQTFVRPTFTLIILVVGTLATGALNAQSKEFVDTTIIPALQLSPTPAP